MAITTPKEPTNQVNHPLKIRKVNIGTEEEPKFVNIGDYWDEETMEKITDLLHEFQDLFSMNFSIDERDTRIFGRDEDPPEGRCEASATTSVSSESMIQRASKI